MSRIAVVGAGYVGLTTAACFADLGNEVRVVDVDPAKVEGLRAGRLHIYEPGLREVVEQNMRAGRLSFTSRYDEAIPGAEFAFIAVSTPEGEGGQADLSAVEAATRSIALAMDGPLVIVNKSTVPIGTGDLVSELVASHNGRHPVRVVSNPEFMREGSALRDFMTPDRVVIGSHDGGAAELVAHLYAPLKAPILITPEIYSAEMIKYASNSFLAARISFINEIAHICERVGADVRVVAEGMGLDHRIGPHFLEAGIGYGGSCFPKDVKALAAIAARFDFHPGLLHAVMDINRDQRMLPVEKLVNALGGLKRRVVGMWGLAFKPNTDDMRDAPSLDIARVLQAGGAHVQAYDPAATDRARDLLPGISLCTDAYTAASGADGLVLVTEWNEFRNLDMGRVLKAMRKPVFVDGRNVYDAGVMRALGFQYLGIGRA